MTPMQPKTRQMAIVGLIITALCLIYASVHMKDTSYMSHVGIIVIAIINLLQGKGPDQEDAVIAKAKEIVAKAKAVAKGG